MTKPRGRPAIFNPKGHILRLLDAQPHGMTCRDISIAVKTSERVVRDHLIELIDLGQCTTMRIAKGNGRPILYYGVTSRPLDPPPGFTVREVKKLPAISPDEQDDSWLEIVRAHKPVGQWRADHVPAVRSVFDLGVAA